MSMGRGIASMGKSSGGMRVVETGSVNMAKASSANWYDGALACWIAKGAASYAEALSDRTGNGNTLPTTNYLEALWNTSGFGSNGLAYFDTGIVPTADYTIYASFTSINVETLRQNILGLQDTSVNTRYYLRPVYTLDRHIFGYGSASQITAPSYSSGVMALNKNGGWYNGERVYTPTGTFSATLLTIALLSVNTNGSFSDVMKSGYCSSACVSAETDDDVTIISRMTAMAAL